MYSISKLGAKNMNETATSLLLEFAVLCFFGLLYYLWQRRKIIRTDLQSVYQEVDKLIYDIKEFLKEESNKDDFKELAQFLSKLEESYLKEDIVLISESLKVTVSKIPTEIQLDINIINDQVQFHIKK
jgi:hypothetical protein